jgi:hypothetical protein
MPVIIILEDHVGNISHQARIDENTPLAQLTPAIITALKLPLSDNSGRLITYHIRVSRHSSFLRI